MLATRESTVDVGYESTVDVSNWRNYSGCQQLEKVQWMWAMKVQWM